MERTLRYPLKVSYDVLFYFDIKMKKPIIGLVRLLTRFFFTYTHKSEILQYIWCSNIEHLSFVTIEHLAEILFVTMFYSDKKL